MTRPREVGEQARYDVYSDAFLEDTHATFARMREESPVHRQLAMDGETPIWFVTRYQDVVSVLLDDRRFTRDRALAGNEPDDATDRPPMLAIIEKNMLSRDGDDHRRLRRLVTKAFTPRRVDALRPRVQAIADDLLHHVRDRRRMDLIDEFAFPLPITVIAELLGIPFEDRDRFRAWSQATITPLRSSEDVNRLAKELEAFVAYLGRLFDQRRREPRDDLITALIQAEEDGDVLSEVELYSMVVLLVIAGFETTTGLIGNAVLYLMRVPARLAELRENPSAIPAAVEEFLRYEPPLERALARWATEDVTLGGRLIRRGELVVPILAAANRDPEVFAEPNELDFAREENRHLGFGRGSHYCLGAPLGRIEGEIALTTLLARLPGLRLDGDVIRWRPVSLFRGLTALPVAWD